MPGSRGPASSVAIAGVALFACGRVGLELTPLDAGSTPCPVACENAHGETACRAGLCVPACERGFGDCDGNAQNGCETGLDDQVATCGACAVTCLNPRGETGCVAGTCAPTCAAGYDDCNADPRDGCEASTASDPRHCGVCGTACQADSEVCVAGACRPSTCPAGRASCGTDPTACEVDTTDSLAHCGFCGNACTIANGTGACTRGSCAVTSCSPGFADCNGLASDGCEASLTSLTHCGGCNTPCTTAVPGAVAECGTGSCLARCSDLSGVWALRIRIGTTWPTGGFIAAGQGDHDFVSRVVLTQSGLALSGSTTPCGREVPPFTNSVTPERYDVVYPPALFDRALSGTSLSVTLGALGPGATFVGARAALPLGIVLGNPVADAWPGLAAARTASGGAGDQDGDGDPGVTITYPTTGGFSSPQTSGTVFAARASRGYLATRVRYTLNGALTSCTQSAGNANAEGIDTHTVGCRLTDNRQCDAGEYGHLDSNAPRYAVRASTYTLVRVAPPGTSVSCATIRAAVP